MLGTGDDLQKGFGQGQDVPVPVQGNVQGRSRVVTGSRSPLRNPFPRWGDCILPLGWLSKQKCQGEDFANLLTLKPAEMQGNALGLQWAGSYTRREEVWGNG